MNISETIQALKAHLYDKVTSPLWGAFVLSWALWNYRFVMVLLSSESFKEKFEYIDLTLQHSDWIVIAAQGVVFPTVSALLLIYLYPIPARKVYEYWHKQQIELKAIQKKIDDERPMTRKEEKELRDSMIQQELSFAKERTERETEVKRLREAVASLQIQLEEHNRISRQPIPITEEAQEPPKTAATARPIDSNGLIEREDLDSHLVKIMAAHARTSSGSVNTQQLSQYLKISQIRAETYAEDLVNKGFLYRGGSGDGGSIFGLTPKGRQWVVSRNLDKDSMA